MNLKKIICWFIGICVFIVVVMLSTDWAMPLSTNNENDVHILTAELTILHDNKYQVNVDDIGGLCTYFDKTYQLVTYTISNDSTNETKQVKVELEKKMFTYRFKRFLY